MAECFQGMKRNFPATMDPCRGPSVEMTLEIMCIKFFSKTNLCTALRSQEDEENMRPEIKDEEEQKLFWSSGDEGR